MRLRCHAHVPNDSVAFRYDDLLPKRMGVRRREKDRTESFLVEDLTPRLGKQPGTTRNPQLLVFKQPPPLQQTEGQVGEQARAADLIEQQQAIGPQRRLDVAKGAADIPRRM